MMPNLSERLLQGAGTAGEQGHLHTWKGLGAAFTGMRNTKSPQDSLGHVPKGLSGREKCWKMAA